MRAFYVILTDKCRERDSNPHSHYWPRDFKSLVSTNSTIAASVGLLSGKRGSNPRPPAWKASALSTELFPQILVQRYHYLFKPPNDELFCASLFSYFNLIMYLDYRPVGLYAVFLQSFAVVADA